jgi:transposase
VQPRTLALHPKTAAKLVSLMKEAETDGVYRVARRIHAVLLNSDGLTSGDIASTLRVARSRVSEWLRSYEGSGFDGLLEGQRSGRPPLITPAQRTALSDIVDSGPVAYGFLSGVWTSVMIARVIAEECGVTYHPGHVRKLLHQIGFSVQRPKRVLAKADPEKRDKWHRITYPALKKSPEPCTPLSSTPTRRPSARTRRSTRRGPGGDTSPPSP